MNHIGAAIARLAILCSLAAASLSAFAGVDIAGPVQRVQIAADVFIGNISAFNGSARCDITETGYGLVFMQ